MRAIKFSKRMGKFLILAILVIGFFPTRIGLAQSEEKFFEETGHKVEGEFLKYFQNQGGLEIFGYPITEAFIDQGLVVQYFQKARLEWHPDNPDPYKVQLGLLADELRYRRPPVAEPLPRSRRRVYFAETGHSVAYAFLDYFIAHGEVDTFGYPVTEMFFEDGKIVQYFQRLKMEWHPDDQTATVRIGNIGELYVSIYRDRMPPEALRPLDAKPYTGEPTAIPSITEIRAVVSLKYSVMSKRSDQTVSVLVTDNNSTPVSDAQVTIHFETPGGEILEGSSMTLLTDTRGFVRAEIPVNGGQTGSQVIVRANVTYATQLATTAQNVFLLWW
ncbi:MAG: Ig-like domain-containing protein [Anaerolineae bacterium]|nr:Ig-like domain-containing protein [Anaerolineae bacterium]